MSRLLSQTRENLHFHRALLGNYVIYAAISAVMVELRLAGSLPCSPGIHLDSELTMKTHIS